MRRVCKGILGCLMASVVVGGITASITACVVTALVTMALFLADSAIDAPERGRRPLRIAE